MVNRSFAQQLLGGDVLGRRFRYTSTEDDILPGGLETGGWYEIVRVVNEFSRRTEIGIRTALGALPRRILASIFSRALRQPAIGVAVGSLLGSALIVRGGLTAVRAAVLLLGMRR